MIYKVLYYMGNDKVETIERGLTKDQIYQKYFSSGYKIISIDRISIFSIPYKIAKLNDLDLYYIFSSLEILIRSGIDIRKSLKIAGSSSKLYKEILNDIDYMISHGISLSDSFKQSGQFPTLVDSVVSAGEESGSLDESFKLLSKYFHNEYKLKQEIKNALYYPIILIIISILVINIVMIYVFPQYIKLFGENGFSELPLLTQILINTSTVLTNNKHIIFCLIMLTIVSFIYIYKQEKYCYKLHRLLLCIPILGKYLLNLELQRYSGVLSITTLSGLSLIKCLDISSNTIKNKYLQIQFKKIKDEVIAGSTLYNSIKKIDFSNPIFLNLIHIGEESGTLGYTLSEAYIYFEEHNAFYTKKVIALFEPIIILIVGAFIAVIVMGIALPTFNVVNII